MKIIHQLTLLSCASIVIGCATPPDPKNSEAVAQAPAAPSGAPVDDTEQTASAAEEEATEGSAVAASEEQVVQMAPGPKSDMVCRDEARTGTRLKKRRCYSRKQLDETARHARDWIRTGGKRGGVSPVREPKVSEPE